MSQEVGIRELRQNLSKYLRRVARGETLRVTDRGIAVAILGPLPEEASTLSRLEREGRLTRARLDLKDLGMPSDRPHKLAISEALRAEREES